MAYAEEKMKWEIQQEKRLGQGLESCAEFLWDSMLTNTLDVAEVLGRAEAARWLEETCGQLLRKIQKMLLDESLTDADCKQMLKNICKEVSPLAADFGFRDDL